MYSDFYVVFTGSEVSETTLTRSMHSSMETLTHGDSLGSLPQQPSSVHGSTSSLHTVPSTESLVDFADRKLGTEEAITEGLLSLGNVELRSGSWTARALVRKDSPVYAWIGRG